MRKYVVFMAEAKSCEGGNLNFGFDPLFEG